MLLFPLLFLVTHYLVAQELAIPDEVPQAHEPRASNGCQVACSFLNTVMFGKVSYLGSPVYVQESNYYSQQQSSVLPVCRVTPTSADDVSTTLRTLVGEGCPFAVKSGGNAPSIGASNIPSGVTIDLVKLNVIALSNNNSTTSVGAGNRWSNVSSHLDTLGLAVVGGRTADVGVGGLTLGGGTSFFSGRYGFACDNVNNYEVVFANGSINDVNLRAYPDLYWALRGGGNNFGIVTRFDLDTFAQGNLWGGKISWVNNYSEELLQVLVDYNENASKDPFANPVLTYVYVQAEDIFVVVGEFGYGKPVVNPPIFQPFTAIPSISSTLRISNLTALTIERESSHPTGYRETLWTASFKNNATLMSVIRGFFVEEITNIKDVTGLSPACAFEPITKGTISHFGKNGGNALGVDRSDGPLIVYNIAISWNNTVDDDRVMTAANNTMARANAAAKSMGLTFPWIYQNYAAQGQHVFQSYGAANHERLIQIQQKYDPTGVFSKLQPGYFKL